MNRLTTALMLLSLVACNSAVAQSPKPTAEQKAAGGPDAPVFGDFKDRIDKYVQLRKKADDSAPPLKESKSGAAIKAAQQGLAERIGAARAGVKQGNIFTPEIAVVFRRLLRPEAKDGGTKAAIEADKPASFSFKVNGPYPDKQPVATMPVNVLAALPQLPEGVEYRFIDKHMILRDSRANLIIDYMPNAIP